MSNFGFKNLVIWQRSIKWSATIYKLTENFPDAEKFGLINQIRRCSASVSSNIAEGYGRFSNKEFIHFLRIARGSLYESVSQLVLCSILGFIPQEKEQELESEAEEIDKMFTTFINNLEKKIK